ncbi:MAG: endonuclease [Gemmataceae bacterium]
MRLLSWLLLVGSFVPTALVAELPKGTAKYVTTARLDSPDATQAAAADETHVYAISNRRVAKYDRATGKLVGLSSGPAEHLNSGVFHEGKLYCAHSNFPNKPDQSDIRVYDPQTQKLTVFHTFTNPPGSLTWCLPRKGDWWCHFAHYGDDNSRSVLIRYDADWKERGRWTYPKALIADWGQHSLSGGIWDGDTLLATNHDDPVLYRLRLPKKGSEIEVVEVIAAPFTGQGIAADPKTGGLVGIDRPKRQIVFAELQKKGSGRAPRQVK